MESRVSDTRSNAKKGHRPRRGQSKLVEEAMEEVKSGSFVSWDEESGTVRVKLVVSKHELRQMVASRSCGGRNGSGHHVPVGLEQLLQHVLRRRQMKKADAAKALHRTRWRPSLQSIPEEL